MAKIIKTVKRFKWFVLVIIAIVIILILGQYLLNKTGASTGQTQSVSDTVKKGTVKETVSASGQIQTANYLAITTSVNGVVKKVLVKEGDKVKSGQKIMEVTLDSEGEKSRVSAYADYLKAKNSLASAQNQLYSLENLLNQKEDAFDTIKETTSYATHDERISYDQAENDYLKAKGDYDAQVASIEASKLSLNTAWLDYQSQSPIITAPADGTIANILAVEGTKIENSVSERSVVTVASIKQEGTPIAQIDVTELDIGKIKVGQKVELTLDSISDRTFTGVVAGIDKIGESSSGVANYPIIIKFDTDNDSILPNMGVIADIIINQKDDVLYVPTAAVQTKGGKSYVQTVANGNTQSTEVQTGISDNDNTEIVSGLDEGEEILLSTLPTTGFTTTSTGETRGGGAGVFGTFTRR